MKDIIKHSFIPHVEDKEELLQLCLEKIEKQLESRKLES